nr:hypothetical protein [Tanacetum cinerariifolium]
MEVIDLEDNSIDAVILNSMAIANEYFQTALGTSNPYALRETVVEVPIAAGMILDVSRTLSVSFKRLSNIPWSTPRNLINLEYHPQKGFFYMFLLDVVSPFLLRLLQSTVEPTSSASKDQNCLQCGLVRVKPMFVKYCDKARGSASCILLFDELDSIATQVIHWYQASCMKGVSI